MIAPTTPINFSSLEPALLAVARHIGAEKDEGVSMGGIIAQHAQHAQARVRLCRGGYPPGARAPDDPYGLHRHRRRGRPGWTPAGHHPGVARARSDRERWLTAILPKHLEAVLAVGSAALAARFGVTPRCAQQIMAAATELPVQGVLLFLAGGKEGGV